jgi:hypothetical protein
MECDASIRKERSAGGSVSHEPQAPRPEIPDELSVPDLAVEPTQMGIGLLLGGV